MPSALRAGCCCLVPFVVVACATAPARIPSHPAGGTFTLFGDDSAEESRWSERLADPLTAPYLFESPVIESQVRPVLIRHWFPKDGIFGGGRVDIAAAQLRLALTDRLAFIAVKDGRAEFEPHAGPDQSGTIDVAGGLKYALLDDPRAGTLVTAGLTYETDAGDADILQGGSHGVWRPFLSGAAEGDDYDVLWNVGLYHGVSDHETADFVDWHLHCSWETGTPWRPLVEVNGIHYVQDGDGLPVDVDGLDYTNIGSQDLDNADWITGALGVRYRLTRDVDLGLAYERPLTQRDDIFDDRITADAVIRF